jgi:DNA-binding NtrC family response regulator
MSNQETRCVLIADGDLSIRSLLGAIVTRLGREPVMAEDGHTACRLVDTLQIDAVILDPYLPDGKGSEVFRHLAMHRPSLIARTVVVTTAIPRHDGDLKGVAAVIRKPFALDEFVDVLRRCWEDD